jgi:hypothetical protein
VRPDAWLARWREVEREDARADLLRRFLAAHGPAARDEFTEWAGGGHVRGLRPTWQRVADELAEVAPKRFLLARDVAEFEQARASRVVRLLPAFDPFLLPRQTRPHLVRSAEEYARIYRPQGWITPVVLQGGRAVAVWQWKRKGAKLEVSVEPLEPLRAQTGAALEREATALARYLGAERELILPGRSRP